METEDNLPDAVPERKSRPSSDDANGSKCEIIEEGLLRVYDVAEIDSSSRKVLQDFGITKLQHVLEMRDHLKEGKVGVLRKSAQTRLLNFCFWHGNFYLTNEREVHWIPVFTGDCFDAFVEGLEKFAPESGLAAGSRMKKLFDHAVSMLHDGPGMLSKLPETTHESLYAYIVQATIAELSEDLIKTCHFNVKDLIKTCAKAIFNLPSGSPYPKIQIMYGSTQSGKSNIKAVVQATCSLLRCPLIIITKGVAESKDLSKKIAHLLSKGNCPFDAWWGAVEHDNRSLVIPDTAARIKKRAISTVNELRSLKPNGKFVVIVDESDAMYRTDERSQSMEQAYDELMDLMPALRIEISATPIPTLAFLWDSGYEVELQRLGSSEDYSGVMDMKPLRHHGGHDIFLSAKDIKYNTGVKYIPIKKGFLTECDNNLFFPELEFEGKFKEVEARNFFISGELDFIPCTDSSVMCLYENALAETGKAQSTKKGILLLDCTINRVTADLNIFQKAACVQNHYFRKGKPLTVVVFVGNGIYVRRPGFLHGRKVSNGSNPTMSEVLNRLDEELGLDMPIFVFGYNKMRRAISYRSDERVPTHMTLSLGLAQSNESYIQALGRGTFNGLKTVLNKNGFSHVTVLTSESDLAMARKYSYFVHEVDERLQNGELLESILRDGKKKFKDSSNFLRHTNRKTGQIKRLKTLLPQQGQFEKPVSGDLGRSRKLGDIGLRIMRAVLDLVHETVNPPDKIRQNENGVFDLADSSDEEENGDTDLERINERGFTVAELKAKYNDTYQEDGHSIETALLKRELNQLKTDAKLEKTDDGRWRAKNLQALWLECEHSEDTAANPIIIDA